MSRSLSEGCISNVRLTGNYTGCLYCGENANPAKDSRHKHCPEIAGRAQLIATLAFLESGTFSTRTYTARVSQHNNARIKGRIVASLRTHDTSSPPPAPEESCPVPAYTAPTN